MGPMDTTRPSFIDHASRELIEEYARVVERAAEESLETGLYGVLVWWDVDGRPRAEVNMKVPYGTIAEHQGPLHTFRGVTHVRV